jgi:transposase InsO family protein
VDRWSERSELPISSFVRWLGISTSKFYQWRQRYGQPNEHNGSMPRDFWIEEWEREVILSFHQAHPDDGYRRLAFMMLDAGVVAVSPSTVWRILHDAGLLKRWSPGPSLKGKGFKQPAKPHKHWHIDVSYLNIRGTFYYLCSVLDGYSRAIVHWEIREAMRETDVELILQRARELFPGQSPRVISDNGPQFIARDFKEFIRIAGMTHVRTSPYYSQSNGKIERWHQSLKRECIRPKTPLSLADARRLVADYVRHYNSVRLHSALGYITPEDKLDGREATIILARKRKLNAARAQRKHDRQLARNSQVEEECLAGVN